MKSRTSYAEQTYLCVAGCAIPHQQCSNALASELIQALQVCQTNPFHSLKIFNMPGTHLCGRINDKHIIVLFLHHRHRLFLEPLLKLTQKLGKYVLENYITDQDLDGQELIKVMSSPHWGCLFKTHPGWEQLKALALWRLLAGKHEMTSLASVQAAAHDHSHHKIQHLQYWQFHIPAGNYSKKPRNWREEYAEWLVPTVCHPEP